MEIPFGYCHCGCGQKTNLAKRDRPDRGVMAGEPFRFVFRHKLGVKPSPTQLAAMGERSLHHGHARKRFGRVSRTYRIWGGMKARCLNPKAEDFKHYGGRGIKVCERWMKFENFLADMGSAPDGMSIDRFPDVDGDYKPGNCRWADAYEQQRNRRNVWKLEWNGVLYTVPELAQRFNLSYSTLKCRLKRGMELRVALTKPYDNRRVITESGPMWKARLLERELGTKQTPSQRSTPQSHRRSLAS